MRDPVQWTSPSPLWAEAADAADPSKRQSALRRPAILRFASDSFMDDLIALLANDPASLGSHVAQPETWRGPAADAPVERKKIPTVARMLNRLRLKAIRQQSASLTLTGGGLGASSLIVGGGVGAAPKSDARPLKLYQPAHQRYYLINACLVCGRAGLPDRAVSQARQERAGFVIRRLFPPGALNVGTALSAPDATWQEYAFVTTPEGNGWQKAPAVESPPATEPLAAGEEQLPLFPMNFLEDDGRRRRLFAGLIPVGKREAYMGAASKPEPGDPAPVGGQPKPVDPRMMLVWSQVTEPWKRLLERANAARLMQRTSPQPTDFPQPPSTDEDFKPDALTATVKATREQIQTVSWLVLLDFANFLKDHLSEVWKVVNGTAQPNTLDPKQTKLFEALTGTTPAPNLAKDLTNDTVYVGPPAKTFKALYKLSDVPGRLSDALKLVVGYEQQLESVKTSYDRDKADPQNSQKPDPAWPPFLFPLADSLRGATAPPLTVTVLPKDAQLDVDSKKVDKLAELIADALPPQPTGPAPALSLAARPVMDTREGWFVIRCVFERPECGPLDQAVVSEPTRPFQMAGFFDPDAPARPIRIPLPLDTSPAGLRKFDKNTAFMLSDMLCGQVNRLKGMSLGDLIRSVLPWPLHKDLSVPDGGPCKDGLGLEVGMICSLSIPIITICALLLLMIIVSLLDIIFRWVPFFLICFPLPKFKAK
jgi:hypothetical protein